MTTPSDRASQESNAAEWTAAADLVRRIQAGDPQAESELVARYVRGLTVIVARACHDRAAVDDVCQDTFRIAIERLRRGELREPERLSGFMCSLAKNLVHEHVRVVARQYRLAADVEPPPDAGPSPLDLAERQERATLVRQLLAELHIERDRLVLWRHYVAEDSTEQICADLGLTRAHLSRVLFRARQRFRELYEQAQSQRGSRESFSARPTLSKKDLGVG